MNRRRLWTLIVVVVVLALGAGLVVDELDLLRTAQRAVHRLALLDDQLVDELRREVGGGADDAGRRHAANADGTGRARGDASRAPPSPEVHGPNQIQVPW